MFRKYTEPEWARTRTNTTSNRKSPENCYCFTLHQWFHRVKLARDQLTTLRNCFVVAKCSTEVVCLCLPWQSCYSFIWRKNIRNFSLRKLQNLKTENKLVISQHWNHLCARSSLWYWPVAQSRKRRLSCCKERSPFVLWSVCRHLVHRVLWKLEHWAAKTPA